MKDKTVTVRMESTKYNRLTKLAASMDRPKAFIIEDALNKYLDVNEWQVAEIKKTIAAADAPDAKWFTQKVIEKEFLS